VLLLDIQQLIYGHIKVVLYLFSESHGYIDIGCIDSGCIDIDIGFDCIDIGYIEIDSAWLY